MDYAALLRKELSNQIEIEKILKRHAVKCQDWIGLVQELAVLMSPATPEAPHA